MLLVETRKTPRAPQQRRLAVAVMTNQYPEIMQEFIDFINKQSGVFVDCLYAFSQNKVRMERQVARVLRRSGLKIDGNGTPVMMHSSYEDPNAPEVVHIRIGKADEYINDNSPNGYNEQQVIFSLLVFIYTYWEDEIRPKLADAAKVDIKAINCEIMGDLRCIRNCILHTKGVFVSEWFRKLTKLKEHFTENASIVITSDLMHYILSQIKSQTAYMTLESLGVLRD